MKRGEGNNLIAEPFVDHGHPCLQGLQFHGRPDRSRVPNRAESTRILRDDTQKLRGDAQSRQNVVTGHALDAGELILGDHLADGDQLQAILLAVG